MRMLSWAVLTGLVLALPGTASAAPEDLAGTYKVRLFLEGQNRTLWLLKLKPEDGKLSGEIIARLGDRAPQATVSNVTTEDGLLKMTLTLQRSGLPFEGRIPEGKGKTIYGTLLMGGRLVLAELEPTQLTKLEPFDVLKDELAQATAANQVFELAQAILSMAAANKAKPEEVRSWAERAYKAADPYGPRQSRDTAMSIAEALMTQEEYADTALAYARRAERLLDAKDRTAEQRRVLRALAEALKRAGKADELKEVEARLAKILPVKPAAYAGRKAKSDRVALVELFTGTQCPPCVAADLAFDALGKTYQPSDAILLQYHVHVPGPDPLANTATDARLNYYGMLVEGTPTMLFNGKPGAEGGGGEDAAQEKYDEYRKVLDELLEKAGASPRLTARATRKGDVISISAEAEGAKAGERVALRLALVEAEVAYAGPNRVPTHHHVVRAMPGGAAGTPLKEGAGKASATVDLGELRKQLTKYLEEFAKDNEPFPGKLPSLEMKDLHVVAFLQDDKTKEVLQAVQVDIKPE